MHAARWSVFFCLLGITALIPAYFVPAVLVANAIDGSKWLSVWTGIQTFWDRGMIFLAALVFVFSMVFPLVKFGLCLLCAAGTRLPLAFRRKVVKITEWTAKYSMLDVFVIAMLILLVKVDESIRMLPSLGLYLFAFAILCSAIASSFLHRALHPKGAETADPELPAAPQLPAAADPRKLYLPWLAAGAVIALCGGLLANAMAGGKVDRIIVTNLTKRPIPRTLERIVGMRDLAKPESKFWSKETWTKFKEMLQTASTDAGWQTPQAFLHIELNDGAAVETERQEIDFDDPNQKLEFTMPKQLALPAISQIKLMTKVKYIGVIPSESAEEVLTVSSDPYRKWTRLWFGRIFQFEMEGPRDPLVFVGAGAAALGLVLFYWAGSGLLCGRRRS